MTIKWSNSSAAIRWVKKIPFKLLAQCLVQILLCHHYYYSLKETEKRWFDVLRSACAQVLRIPRSLASTFLAFFFLLFFFIFFLETHAPVDDQLRERLEVVASGMFASNRKVFLVPNISFAFWILLSEQGWDCLREGMFLTFPRVCILPHTRRLLISPWRQWQAFYPPHP